MSSASPGSVPSPAIETLPPARASRVFTWNRCATVAWCLVALAIAIRVAHAPHRGTSFTPYLTAGGHWLKAEPLYQAWKGFVYSPLVAAFFSIFTWTGEGLGNLLWRFLNGGILAWGLLSLFTKGPFDSMDRRRWGMVFLLVLPLVLGNIDTAQANPLVIGLTMLAVSAASARHWIWSALAIGLATHLKIYPLAVGLLLCVVAPRKMPVRLALVLLALTLLPFLLQKPAYVSAQYQSWISTRMADDRLSWGPDDVPVDGAYVLSRVMHIPVSRTVFRIAEVVGGALIAVFCAWMAARRWSMRRMLANLFLLASLWMLLLGPATEPLTYAMLGPCASLCAVESLERKTPLWLRSLAWGGYLLLFEAVAKASFAPHLRNVYFRAVQPIGAMVLLAFTVGWILLSHQRSAERNVSSNLP